MSAVQVQETLVETKIQETGARDVAVIDGPHPMIITGCGLEFPAMMALPSPGATWTRSAVILIGTPLNVYINACDADRSALRVFYTGLAEVSLLLDWRRGFEADGREILRVVYDGVLIYANRYEDYPAVFEIYSARRAVDHAPRSRACTGITQALQIITFFTDFGGIIATDGGLSVPVKKYDGAGPYRPLESIDRRRLRYLKTQGAQVMRIAKKRQKNRPRYH